MKFKVESWWTCLALIVLMSYIIHKSLAQMPVTMPPPPEGTTGYPITLEFDPSTDNRTTGYFAWFSVGTNVIYRTNLAVTKFTSAITNYSNIKCSVVAVSGSLTSSPVSLMASISNRIDVWLRPSLTNAGFKVYSGPAVGSKGYFIATKTNYWTGN